jgi:SAM-dependent methyltransferase
MRGRADRKSKAGRRIFYDGLNRYLERLSTGDGIIHLNYGYVSDSSSSRALIHERDGNTSTDLVLEVIGDCDLNQRDVIDIGCGRGGTVCTILEFWPGVRTITGVDLSAEAISFCSKACARKNAFFVVGDSEHIPLKSTAADAIINIESACCYPDVYSFYREVWRILRPGGRFLYADSIERAEVSSRVDYLASLGFKMLDSRDITRNVVLACDRRADEAAQSGNGPVSALLKTAHVTSGWNAFVANLICMPGSRKYQKYAAGAERYIIFDLQK